MTIVPTAVKMSSLHFQRTGEKRFSGRLQLNNRENKIHSGHKKVPRNKSAVYTPVSAVSPKKRAAEEEAGGKVLSKKVKAGELTGSVSVHVSILKTSC